VVGSAQAANRPILQKQPRPRRTTTAHDRLLRCVELAREQNLGRIEVSNLAQIADTQLTFDPSAKHWSPPSRPPQRRRRLAMAGPS
jgi:hypothetical protein